MHKVVKVPIEEITTPKTGRVAYVDHWWSITEDSCVLFYLSEKEERKKIHASPQCNMDQKTSEMLNESLGYKEKYGAYVRKIHVAYMNMERY